VAEDESTGPKGLIDTNICYLGAAGMLALFALVLYGVGMRYIFSRPPLWSADVPNLVFIWLVFVAVGLTVKLGPQIRVVFFVAKLPRAGRRALLIVSHLTVLLMLATFIWFSIPIIELSGGSTMLSTGWSDAVFFYALPVGCVVMAYYHIWALVQVLRGRDEEMHSEGGA
jgi:TRAP-type C4-dicarboxylate transport system permease small subunit